MEENNDDLHEKSTNQNNLIGKPSGTKSKIGVIIIITIASLIIGGIGWYLGNYNANKDNKDKVNNGVDASRKNTNEAIVKKISSNSLEDFDLKLLQLENKEENIIYSPLAVKNVLQMLKEGASGDTKTQIENVIGTYKTNNYTNSSNMTLVNALVVKNSFADKINKNYISTIENKYNAKVIYDDFENGKTINDLLKNNTHGLIKDVVDIVPQNDFYLINLLAIDMEWNKKIQAVEVNDRYEVNYLHEDYYDNISPLSDEKGYPSLKFNNTEMNTKAVEIGASINNYDVVKDIGEDNIRTTITKEYNDWVEKDECDYSSYEDTTTFVNNFINELDSNYQQLHSSTDFELYVDEDVKVFAKDLKTYDKSTLQYIGIMPIKEKLSNFIKNTNAKSIDNLINNLKTISLTNFDDGYVTRIKGTIPLFKYNYKLDLIDDLKQLGIIDVFDLTKANLSTLTSVENSYINEALHKTNIEFSNEGIKASSIIEIGGAGDASCDFEHNYKVPIKTIDLTFNNPYMYLIRDKNTGEIWFVGTVYEGYLNDETGNQNF